MKWSEAKYGDMPHRCPLFAVVTIIDNHFRSLSPVSVPNQNYGQLHWREHSYLNLFDLISMPFSFVAYAYTRQAATGISTHSSWLQTSHKLRCDWSIKLYRMKLVFPLCRRNVWPKTRMLCYARRAGKVKRPIPSSHFVPLWNSNYKVKVCWRYTRHVVYPKSFVPTFRFIFSVWRSPSSPDNVRTTSYFIRPNYPNVRNSKWKYGRLGSVYGDVDCDGDGVWVEFGCVYCINANITMYEFGSGVWSEE